MIQNTSAYSFNAGTLNEEGSKPECSMQLIVRTLPLTGSNRFLLICQASI